MAHSPNDTFYDAPILLTPGDVPLPSGTFLLPICTNRERFGAMFNALMYANMIQPTYGHLDHCIDLIEAMAWVNNPEGAMCMPEVGVCNEYLPIDAPATYEPNNPFTTPNLIPSGYAVSPWYNNPLIPIPGVIPSDAMVNFLSIPTPATLTDIISSGLPRVRFEATGIRTCEIELVKVPQGGLALVTTDDNPLSAQVIDLNSLSIGSLSGVGSILSIFDLALDLEVTTTEIIEIEFATDTVHHIDVTFLPNIDLDVIIGFGGGIRRFEICGEGVVPEMTCCDDLEEQVDAINSYLPRIIIDQLPSSVTSPSKPKTSFITDPADTTSAATQKRLRAACATVYKYMGELARQAGNELNITAINSGWTAFLATLISGEAVSAAYFSGAIVLAGLTIAVMSDYDAWAEVVCCFQQKLGAATGNTFAIFQGLLDSPDCDLSANAQIIALFVHLHNQEEYNYKLFNSLLSNEYISDIAGDPASQGRCAICDPCAINHVFASNPFGVVVTKGLFQAGVGYKNDTYIPTGGSSLVVGLYIDVLCPEPGYIRLIDLDVAFKNNGGGGSLFAEARMGSTVLWTSGGQGGLSYGTGARGITHFTIPGVGFWGDRIRIRQECPNAASQFITLWAAKVQA